VIPLEHVLILSAALFCIGLFGVLSKRNAVVILMSIELMLNAVNINFIAFAVYFEPTDLAPSPFIGIIFAIFVIIVSAAEVGLALAIVLRLYRNRASVNVDEINLMKW